MSSLGDRFSSPAPVRRVTGRAVLLAIAVLVLTAGVVAMHSLGLGHHTMAITSTDHQADARHEAVASQASAVASQASAVASQASAVALQASAVASDAESSASRCPTCLTALVASSSGLVHDMGTMCLAVLPLLLPMLRLLLARRAAVPARPSRPRRLPSFVAGGRSPPEHLRPCLSKLCILRS